MNRNPDRQEVKGRAAGDAVETSEGVGEFAEVQDEGGGFRERKLEV